MIYKITGAILVFCGIVIIAKFDRHLIGLILIFIGFYLGMKKGMKPL